MEEDFRALLTGNAGVSALTSEVNWGAHPQGEDFPAVVLNVISGAEDRTLDGPDGLFRGRVQVDCYAMTYGSAKLLQRAVTAAIDGYGAAPFQGIFWIATRDQINGDAGAAERPFRVSLDFLVLHNS